MEAVKKDHWYFVVLVTLPFFKAAVQQTAAAETVRLEEGMILDCLCPWEGNLSMVSWTKVPEKDPVAVFHPEFGVAFAHQYRERIEFLRKTPMDGSISMRNVTHQDIGMYHCSVQTFPQGPWTRNIQVEDLDEPPEYDDDTIEPPTPVVFETDTELVVEQNDNLTISCNSKRNATVYQVIMEKMVYGQPWSIIGVCKKVEGGLMAEDYSDRGHIRCAESLDVSLHLAYVEEEDSGLYRCNFSTDTGTQTTSVTLTVTTSGWFNLSTYMLYFYFGAGTAGLVLLIVIIIVVMRYRKRNRREEYRVKLHPSHRQPNLYANIPACPRFTNRDRSITVQSGPVYANLHTVQSHRAQSRPHR